MRCTFLGVLVVSVATPFSLGQDKSSVELDGAWKLISVERGGEREPLAESPRFVWVIKNNRVHYGGEELGVLSVDATTTPKTSDFTFAKAKKVVEGIYTADKNTLKMCFNRQSEGVRERPGDFATKGKETWTLLTFERLPAGESATECLGGFVGVALAFHKDKNEVTVANTLPGSPAEKAGLKKDDVVLQVGSVEATALVPVVNAVRSVRPGTEITFRIRRTEKEQAIPIKAGLLPFFFLD